MMKSRQTSVSVFAGLRQCNGKLRLWFFAAMLIVFPAHAIVYRHDTGYAGFLARAADYPAVFPLHTQKNGFKICAATLIDKNWAITAAHCAEETPLANAMLLAADYEVNIGGQGFLVDRLVIHPSWPGNAGLRFDVRQVDLALIRLARPVGNVEPLSVYDADDESGQVFTFLGWGHSGTGRTGLTVNDGRLRFARNKVDDAREHLLFTFDNPDGPDSVAVAYEGIPGLGDSGGPALVRRDNKWFVAGVAVGELEKIAGKATGLYGAAVVYERLSRHREWVVRVIESET
jgi:hypothetical protein